MALLWVDPLGPFTTTATLGTKFDHVGNTAWTTIAASGGRWGGAHLRMTVAAGIHGGVGWNVPASDTKIVQVAWRIPTGLTHTGTTPCPVVYFMEGGTPHVGLFIIPSTNVLQIRRGTLTSSVQLGSDLPLAPSIGTWYYIKMKVKVHDSAGTVDCIINEVVQCALTGQDTRDGATGTISRINLGSYAAFGGGTQSAFDFQDAATCDTTGSAPMNDFHPEGRVHAGVPTSDGDATDWTANTGTRWEAVDDAAPDGDTTYITSGTVGHRALFNRTAITSNPVTVYGACTVNVVAKDDAGTSPLKGLLKVGGTEYEGAVGGNVSGTSYVGIREIFENDPDTGSPWASVAAWNAAQSGVKKV